ncbi:MAG TPA: hypothetical protein VKZ79_13110 [Alphaproteobacteria bacterium]|nr:hypothetical protein [Alphaproteobacteria bacterium]
MLPASLLSLFESAALGAPRRVAALALPCVLAACGPDYSPNTYSSAAVQHAEKVDQGVVVGVRVVSITADSTIGTATGGAAGGIAGSQIGQGPISALGAVGGTVAGGLVGNAIAHSTDDTFGYEYIVRKPNGDLLSVTQKDLHPLDIGQHVLIIEGPQARIVPDYTVQVAGTSQAGDAQKSSEARKSPEEKPATTGKPDQPGTTAAPAQASQTPAKPQESTSVAAAPIAPAQIAPSSQPESQPSPAPQAPKADSPQTPSSSQAATGPVSSPSPSPGG